MANKNHIKKAISYDRAIYIFLSLYRFFSYVIAVLIIQVIPLDSPRAPGLQIYTALGVIGVYTLFKVFVRFKVKHNDRITYLILGADVFICTLVLFFNGGINSGFLLYSLNPIITASLLFEERIALIMAAIPSFAILIIHTFLSRVWHDSYVWIMTGNYLPIILVYIGFCFLVATLTYRTNFNIRRRIETNAILEERGRIRRELHDGVAQTLGYLNLKAKLMHSYVQSTDTKKSLETLDDIQKVIKETYDTVRESIDSLNQNKIIPFIPALNQYIKDFGSKNNIKVELKAPPLLPSLSPVGSLQLMRIANEALTNIRKHSGATHVYITIENTTTGIRIAIKDNGKGFTFISDNKPKDLSGRHGLIIMKERAESLGGNISINSNQDQGTEIIVHIPGEKVRL